MGIYRILYMNFMKKGLTFKAVCVIVNGRWKKSFFFAHFCAEEKQTKIFSGGGSCARKDHIGMYGV